MENPQPAAATTPDLEGLETHVRSLLESSLPPEVEYHDVGHTFEDVVPAAVRLAAAEGLSAPETRLVTAAAILHDVGFVRGMLDHESVSADIAREVLPGFGFARDQIERVAELILATKLGHEPSSVAERVIMDADLDVLGRADFWARNLRLRREMEAFGGSYDESTWWRGQRQFLARHRYRTSAAREARSLGKQRNLRRVERHLESLREGDGPVSAEVVRRFLPYLPQDRRWTEFSSEEGREPTFGAALFADLSGFTRLTQALADAFGPFRGAEELTRYLALAYDALVQPVHAHGGSVIGFSGDAITCWFEGDRGHAAVASGIEMQAALESVPAALAGRPSETRLGVKVAVVRGPARRFVVGDPSIQRIDVLAGRTIDLLAACERHASSGEIVVEEEMAADLDVEVAEVRSDERTGLRVAVIGEAGPSLAAEASATRVAHAGTFRDDAPVAFEAEAWVVPAVRERLRAGAHTLVADFRPSAALFLSFGGIDYDEDPGAVEKLDTFVRWVQEIVTKLDGALIQLTFGDKGSYLYCTFGAPVAHDDDAGRAVAAAQLLVSPPQPYLRDVKVGVTHGRMYAGAYGSADRCTYGVLGPKTNLAARLMSAAEPGQVLCDGEVMRHAQRHWTFQPLPPVQLKGISDPVPIYVPVAPVAGSGTSHALVGRDEELHGMQTALERLARGEAAAVCIRGEAGMGKSRLLEAVHGMCAERDVEVAFAAEHVWGREAPYRPWQTIVRRLLDLAARDHAPDPADLTAGVTRWIPDLSDWAPLLADVFGVDMNPTGLTRDLAPETRSRNLVMLVTELVRARTKARPWALVFDEAHRLDSVSWDLLLAVARTARDAGLPVATVVAYRDQELDARATTALAAWSEVAEPLDLDLPPLTGAALERLLEDRFGLPDGGVGEDLLAFVAQRAAGNPYFAQELAQMMLDDGTIRVRSDGGWKLDRRLAGDAASVPTSLHGLVLARIDRVPSASARTLKIASVIGRQVDVEAVEVGAGAATDASSSVNVVPHLETLVSRDLLAPDQPEGYRFHQVTVHQVAYGSLLFRQRRAIHAAVAAWYEALDRLPAGERAPLLAHHYAHAAAGSGDDALIDTAVDHLEAAADRYERVSAFSEAASAYRIALDLLAERGAPSERGKKLRVRLGDMHERLGEFEEAEAAMREVLAEGARASTEGAAWASLCLILTRRGRYDEAREAGEAALQIADEMDDVGLSALVRGRIGILAAMQGELDQAGELFEGAYRHYLEAGEMRNAAAWSNNLGLGLVFQARFDEAERRLMETLELSRKERIAEIEAQVLMNLGLCSHRQGNLDLAAQRYRESLELCRKLLAREDAVINAINLGDVDLARGDLAGAWSVFVSSARDAWDLGAAPRALDALRGASEALVSGERHVTAAELVGFIEAHPSLDAEVKGELERVVGRLHEVFTTEDGQAARKRGAGWSFDEVAAVLASIDL